MGWSGGTEIFDTVIESLHDSSSITYGEKSMIIRRLIEVLEDQDWDVQNESAYWDTALVRDNLKMLHPEWDWEEIENEDY